MIVSYLKKVIRKKYADFDQEQKRNLFVLYVINLFLPSSLFHWIYFYTINYNPVLLYAVILTLFTFIILYLGSTKGILNFKWYRFLMVLTSMAMLTIPTFVMGKDCICLVGLIFVPIGMILCFSSQEKNTYLKYLGFITCYFSFFIFWISTQEPFVKVSTEVMKEINMVLAVNFVFSALVISYIFFNENSLIQTNLQVEKVKSEKLLLKIFPESIANRLKNSEESIVDNFKKVTVIFIDIANFTQFADTMPPKDLVYMLDELFSAFDTVANKYQIEKIKTIGDAYLAVSGLPNQNANHHINAAKFVLEVNRLVKEQFYAKYRLQIRMGMHTGSVIAGIIGKSKFSYDLWGSTVNLANNFEALGAIGKIHISKEMKNLLCNDFNVFSNGEIYINGVGKQKSYFLES